MEQDRIVPAGKKEFLEKIVKTNEVTAQYGLSLSRQDAEQILAERIRVLQEERRVEFGEGMTDRIICEFCDSAYISQENYVETIIRLQEIFYRYKNETLDEMSDDELLHLMKEQFETICFGDPDYLEGTCLDLFAQAVRGGYDGYRKTDGYGEASQFDDVTRWDYGLYLESLKDK